MKYRGARISAGRDGQLYVNGELAVIESIDCRRLDYKLAWEIEAGHEWLLVLTIADLTADEIRTVERVKALDQLRKAHPKFSAIDVAEKTTELQEAS